jgi:hypothetical protein
MVRQARDIDYCADKAVCFNSCRKADKRLHPIGVSVIKRNAMLEKRMTNAEDLVLYLRRPVNI